LAETAAYLDDLFALRNKFDNLVREARKGLKGAWDGRAQIMQGNESGQIGKDGKA
jgi:predicted ATPase